MVKNRGLLIIVILLLVIPFIFARETITSKEEVRIDFVKCDPSPLQPGHNADIWFEVRNVADEDLTDLKFTFVKLYPFSIQEGKNDTIILGLLKKGEKTSFKFSIIPEKETNTGNHTLGLQYYSSRLDQVIAKSFNVKVERVGTDLIPIQIDVNPEQIPPGENGLVTLYVRNTGEYTMNDVRILLNLESAQFAPYKTTSERSISKISPGEEKEVSFVLTALPDSTGGLYKVPLVMKYYDELGRDYNRSSFIGLAIGGRPELEATIESTDLYSTGSGEVVVKFVNKGLTDIKALNVQLLEHSTPIEILGKNLLDLKDYSILSPDKEYIGGIDADDYETAKFRIDAKKEEIVLEVNADYKDVNNNDYSETFYVNLNIHSAKEMGVQNGASTLQILVIIILIIIFFLSYRGWRKINEGKGLKNYIFHLAGKLRKYVGLIVHKLRRKNYKK